MIDFGASFRNPPPPMEFAGVWEKCCIKTWAECCSEIMQTTQTHRRAVRKSTANYERTLKGPGTEGGQGEMKAAFFFPKGALERTAFPHASPKDTGKRSQWREPTSTGKLEASGSLRWKPSIPVQTRWPVQQRHRLTDTNRSSSSRDGRGSISDPMQVITTDPCRSLL